MDSTVNDIYMDSDYVSPGADTTAPTVTAGIANRTSDTEATVKFHIK